MAKPEPVFGIADFAALFEDSGVSHSFYAMRGEQKLMARVLLSPNVVFEASRSSVIDAPTSGPIGAIARAPDLNDALGYPVPIFLSSLLLRYLSGKGSALIAPAITSKENGTCDSDNLDGCWPGTWLERLMRKAVVAPADPSAEATATVALAVREIGMTEFEVPVVARRDNDRISFHPRRSMTEKSVCGPLTLSIPIVTFSAELVSLLDGRLLARIHEERMPELDVSLRTSIDLVTWKAMRRTGYDRVRWNRPVSTSKYRYVRRWRRTDVACSTALKSYRRIRSRAERAMRLRLAATVGEMLHASLDELYAHIPTDVPK